MKIRASDDMLSEKEIELLKLASERMLVRRDEIERFLSGNEGDYNYLISKLVSEGYLNNVEAIGSRCFAITQKGSRALTRSLQ
ncbi:MAG: hypothetical protein GXO64_04625 [Candidatus Micrarchaeota archaeon]|nr:hypothetical protein [Candidatus Micrarchaeota archaeon]